MKNTKGTYNYEIKKTNQKFYKEIDPIEEKSLSNKILLLNKINDYSRSIDSNVKQVTANFLGEKKSVEILRSGGEILNDVRPLIRFNVSIMVEKNGRRNRCLWNRWKTIL